MQGAVLFVDDDAPVCRTLGYIMQDRLPLITAASAPAALELLATHDVAVLLADQRMPATTGTELCAQACQLYPELVTLVTTAFADVSEITAAITAGHVAAYIPKPWTPVQIIEALDFAITQSVARRARCKEVQTGTFAVPGRRLASSESVGALATYPGQSLLQWGPFRVDLLAQRVWVEGIEIADAEPLQVRVLGCLIERAGSVWHRDELCARLYRQGFVNSRALARAVYALRQRCGTARDLIVSVRAVGYGLGVEVGRNKLRA